MADALIGIFGWLAITVIALAFLVLLEFHWESRGLPEPQPKPVKVSWFCRALARVRRGHYRRRLSKDRPPGSV